MGTPHSPVRAPHKHAELIKAWADGAEIQCRVNKSDWVDLIGGSPSWFSEWEYRIKPKTIKYRLYLYKGWASHNIRVGLQENYESDKTLSEGFIRYLGDWQEVEV